MRNIGKISETVLKRSVLKPIKQNKVGITGASTGLDCAFFESKAMSMGYVAYKDSKACKHAIIQACNNLWAQGVEPRMIMLSVSMPDSYREIKLKDIMKQACETAESMQVQIGGGHTEYVQNLTHPVISVTAMGKPVKNIENSNIGAGLDIVMTKWIGLSGTCVIATEKYDSLTERLPAYYVKEAEQFDMFASIAPEAKIALEHEGVKIMHDVAGGGIFTALWEICDSLKCGCDIKLNDIPVLQETIEVCEYFDINPYNLRGDGALLIITESGDKLVEKLKQSEIMAAVIGQTTDNLDRLIVRDEETRFLEPGRNDELMSALLAE